MMRPLEQQAHSPDPDVSRRAAYCLRLISALRYGHDKQPDALLRVHAAVKIPVCSKEAVAPTAVSPKRCSLSVAPSQTLIAAFTETLVFAAAFRPARFRQP